MDEMFTLPSGVKVDQFGNPEITETGVRCGNHDRSTVRHASVAAVLQCFRAGWEQDAQHAAEAWAEGAYVRHAENAGYWEAQAERAMEDARGVIQFDEAYRMACPDLFKCDGCGVPDTQVCSESCPTRKAEERQEAYANSY